MRGRRERREVGENEQEGQEKWGVTGRREEEEEEEEEEEAARSVALRSSAEMP